MELPVTKSKKKKSLQITYPAPYSQSWNPDVTPVLLKNLEKTVLVAPRVPNRLCRTKRAGEPPRAWSHQFQDRPDPTAPHLKYGVFRNRRGSVPKPLPKQERPQKTDRLPKVSAPGTKNLTKRDKSKRNSNPVIKVPHEAPRSVRAYSYTSVAVAEPQSLVQKDNSRYQPVFVCRTIKESYSRKLCQSKVMHIEIKPGRTSSRSLWPTFSPAMSRKFIGAPNKRNYRDPIYYAIP